MNLTQDVNCHPNLMAREMKMNRTKTNKLVVELACTLYYIILYRQSLRCSPAIPNELHQLESPASNSRAYSFELFVFFFFFLGRYGNKVRKLNIQIVIL